MLDGTPVLDIKPYIPFADAHPDASSGWLDNAELTDCK
jgi:tRNA (Thr-GGU) A37 N-methylase